MDIYKHINPMAHSLSALSQQQKTISTNLANAHTPGYTRKTYSFTDVLGQLSNPFETELSRRMGSMMDNQFATDTGAPVIIAEELMDMQQVALNQSMVTRVLTGHVNVLKKATQIGR
ncbi:MAG: hypothetical protein KC476_02470 [Cyanobacteria bacterium HKST-UBA06]|nr:hypothetical protein [Cyanobacteria bacterium HKST-UBA04]MCA9806794.1 hypothetical protein [Cyanobacteria bacterium HKST-UBA06]MCA9841423.1 hypothetical protein [Cyanobacteria bacterium HKST-UBA03]